MGEQSNGRLGRWWALALAMVTLCSGTGCDESGALVSVTLDDTFVDIASVACDTCTLEMWFAPRGDADTFDGLRAADDHFAVAPSTLQGGTGQVRTLFTDPEGMFSGWVVLTRTADPGETPLAAGRLTMRRNEAPSVTLTLVCAETSECAPDTNGCNGLEVCRRGLCVKTPPCGVSPCTEVLACIEGDTDDSAQCTTELHHEQCGAFDDIDDDDDDDETDLNADANRRYCSMQDGCTTGQRACRQGAIAGDPDHCGPCRECGPDGLCAPRAGDRAGESVRGPCVEVRCVDGDLIYDEREGSCPLMAADDGVCVAGDCQPRGVCGNGRAEPDNEERCDEGPDDADGGVPAADACRRSVCQLPTCGDGIVDVDNGEQCDDGNLDTLRWPRLPDGNGGTRAWTQDDIPWTVVQPQGPNGAIIDNDGPFGPVHARCTETCQWNICTDGILGAGEECDDGNGASGDNCALFYCVGDACSAKRSDVAVDGVDDCDDPDDTDCVRGVCRLNICGDGLVNRAPFVDGPQAGMPKEVCDDGDGDANTPDNPNDGCFACAPRVFHDEVVAGHAQSRGDALQWEMSQIPVGMSVDKDGHLLVAAPAEGEVLRVVLPSHLKDDNWCPAGEDVSKHDPSHPPRIMLIAGGRYADDGDNGLGVNAGMLSPIGVDDDGTGNVLVIDRQAQRVRMVDRDGVVRAIAGTGQSPDNLDDTIGRHPQATPLSDPLQGVFSPTGDRAFITESGFARVRMVDFNEGTIVTVAGADDAGAALFEAQPTMPLGQPSNPLLQVPNSIVSVDATVDGVVLFTTLSGIPLSLVHADVPLPIGDRPEHTNFGFNRLFAVVEPGAADAVAFPVGVDVCDDLPPNVTYEKRAPDDNDPCGAGGDTTRNLLLFTPGPPTSDLNGSIYINECMRNRVWRMDVDVEHDNLYDRYRHLQAHTVVGPIEHIHQECFSEDKTVDFIADDGEDPDLAALRALQEPDTNGAEALATAVAGWLADGLIDDDGIFVTSRPYSMAVDPRADRMYLFEQKGVVSVMTKDGRCKTPVLGTGLGVDDTGAITKILYLVAQKFPGGASVVPPLPPGTWFDPRNAVTFATPHLHRVFDARATGHNLAIGQPTPGSDLGATAADLYFNRPRGLALNHRADIVVADQGNNRIVELKRAITGPRVVVQELGLQPATALAGSAASCAPQPDCLYNEEGNDPSAWRFNAPSSVSWDFATCSVDADCVLEDGQPLCTTPDETGCHRCDVGSGRCYVQQAGYRVPSPVLDDALYVADQGNHRIRRLSLFPRVGGPTSQTVIGTGVAGNDANALFREGDLVPVSSPVGVLVVDPADLAIDGSLAVRKFIIVVDRDNHMLQLFADFPAFGVRLVARIGTGSEGGADGYFTTPNPEDIEVGETISLASFSYPRGISFDPFNGVIVVIDAIDRVRTLTITDVPAALNEKLNGQVETIRNGTFAPVDGQSPALNSILGGTPSNNTLFHRATQMAALPHSQGRHLLVADGPSGRVRLWENTSIECTAYDDVAEVHTVLGFPEQPPSAEEPGVAGVTSRLAHFLDDATGVATFANGDFVVADGAAGTLKMVRTLGAKRGPEAPGSAGCITNSCAPGQSFVDGSCHEWKLHDLVIDDAMVPERPAQLATLSNADGSPRAVFVVDEAQHMVLLYDVDDLRLHNARVVLGEAQQRGVTVHRQDHAATELNAPKGIVLQTRSKAPTLDDVDGVFVADTGNHRVLYVQVSGAELASAAALDAKRGGAPYVQRVVGLDGDRAISEDGAPASERPTPMPTGLSLDPCGNLFVAGGNAVRVVAPTTDDVPDVQRYADGVLNTPYGRSEAYPQSATQCMSAVWAHSVDEVWAIDGCQGLAVHLSVEGATGLNDETCEVIDGG